MAVSSTSIRTVVGTICKSVTDSDCMMSEQALAGKDKKRKRVKGKRESRGWFGWFGWFDWFGSFGLVWFGHFGVVWLVAKQVISHSAICPPSRLSATSLIPHYCILRVKRSFVNCTPNHSNQPQIIIVTGSQHHGHLLNKLIVSCTRTRAPAPAPSVAASQCPASPRTDDTMRPQQRPWMMR